jgi:hypothetical protein
MTTTTERRAAADHHVPLGRTGWSLWRDVAVRGAGFPAARVGDICDAELAAAADSCDDVGSRYDEVFAGAVERLGATIRRLAADDRFREAVIWQNPMLVPNCLDRAAAGRRRDVRGRGYELTIAAYLQRYCLKNDTVGFFGPVGWARIGDEDAGLTVTPGPGLLARRTTYFEDWAIEAVAAAISARPEVWPWLRPRLPPYVGLTGRMLHLPFARPIALTADEARLLARCDGHRTVRDLVGDPVDGPTVAALLRLRDHGALEIELTAQGTWPERDLAARIAAIGDPAVRARAAVPLAELTAARDEVAAAAGEPDRLAPAVRMLADTFERITGHAANRRAGRSYAGRTPVIEDTVRDAEVHIGRRMVDRLAAPLGLVLDSALWLLNTLGERYEARARTLLDGTGRDSMPLTHILAAVLPELLQPGVTSTDSPIVDEVVADFQARWHRVLDLPEPGPRRHAVTADGIAGRAAREFATGPPRWSGARLHSPDLMVAADDLDALARGDVDVVLGELHCGNNTLEGRLFVAQHLAVERLRAAAQAGGLAGRVVFVARQGTERTPTRLARSSEMMLPTYAFVCTGTGTFAPPAGATVVSVVDLSVHRHGTGVVVRHRRGLELRFLEVIGEPLAALFLGGFRPVAGAPHRPRVSIDRLVLSRETWTWPAAALGWATVGDERRRYALARRWRATVDLPERCFFRVPVERKPLAVDFRSLPLVNLFAKAIRRTLEAGGGPVTVSEMLPDTDQLWLSDARGARYTAELRLIAVRPAVPD